MSANKLLARAATISTAAFLLASAGTASAQEPSERASGQAVSEDVRGATRDRIDQAPAPTDAAQSDEQASPGHQHGGDHGHLPATRKNVELVSKLTPTKQFGDIVEGQIADLSVFKGYAYLNSWNEPTCTRGGVYMVDIRNPAQPKEVGFLPALAGNYHGEGAHVIDVRTRGFKGNLLAVNNELCDGDAARGGGFDLYDVSDPRNPQILVQGFGDFGGEGSLAGEPDPVANEYHSVFLWQDGQKVYLVGVDNEELHDVDIFDVTNPRAPVGVAEHDLVELFPQIVDQSANGNNIFLHDMVVKEINGTQTMMASYWDAGYVKLDVENPAAPQYLGDTSFDGPDPLLGFTPQEGNAHQSEFSADNRFVLAADEDFSPYRAGSFSITTGAGAGEYPAQEVGGGTSVSALPDRRLNGPVVYGGYGCDASAPVPQRAAVDVGPLAEGEEAILVLQRGPSNDPSAPEAACFPGEKAKNADAAGWDAVVLVNRHLGAAANDTANCGSGGYPPGAEIVTVCTTHAAMHRMFGSEPRFELPVGADDAPALGTVGERVQATAVFDGWGYAHLYRNENGKMREVDAYAIPEALDPQYAFGFGDLSIHEFAADPKAKVAYASYYSGGMRVFRFGARGLRETGHFIDEGGSNFWGVETFTNRREQLFAGSDRDYGLYVFRYTGPGSDDD